MKQRFNAYWVGEDPQLFQIVDEINIRDEAILSLCQGYLAYVFTQALSCGHMCEYSRGNKCCFCNQYEGSMCNICKER